MIQRIKRIIANTHSFKPYYNHDEPTLICRVCHKWFDHPIHKVDDDGLD